MIQSSNYNIEDESGYISTIDHWKPFPKERPTQTKRYIVQRKDGKIHFEKWNGSGWAYNNKTIEFFMEVFPVQKM